MAFEKDEYLYAATAIRNSHHLVAFTGAGISIESGIPTFRGPGGLWTRYDPRYLEIDYFLQHPEECWLVLREAFYEIMLEARPNDAHIVLGKWEEKGLLKAVITQNIDGLHQEAGSRNIVEYHGNSRNLECVYCGRIVPASLTLTRDTVPKCTYGRIMKPSFVFFGEEIPPLASYRANEEADKCDVMLIIGTTGSVLPANLIPVRAKRSGATIIEINPQPGEFTGTLTDIFIREKATVAMKKLDSLINQSTG